MKRRNINILILIVMFLFCGLISIGYSSLSKTLSITGDLAYRKYEDIRITNVTQSSTYNGGSQTTSATFGYKKISGAVNLPNLNSKVTLNVTVHNYSTTINKMISTIQKTSSSNDNIIIEIQNYTLEDKIEKSSEISFRIVFKYDENITEVPSNKNLTYVLTATFGDYVDDMIIENSPYFQNYQNSDNTYDYLNGPIRSDP